MSVKICSICKLPKDPEKDFNKNPKRKDGLQTHCRECNKSRSKNYYQHNKEHHKKTILERNKKQRNQSQQYVYDYLKSNGCVDCGETDPRCLEFDHLRDKKNTISRLVGGGYSIPSIMKEIEKCEIRCANCHRKKTATDFDWYKNIIQGPITQLAE